MYGGGVGVWVEYVGVDCVFGVEEGVGVVVVDEVVVVGECGCVFDDVGVEGFDVWFGEIVCVYVNMVSVLL